jgi:hypothetical protein
VHINSRLLFALSLLFWAVVPNGWTQSVVYYVNAGQGHDDALGTSPDTAWQTLTRVNQQTFRPGDRVLFHCADRWKGQLRPRGSGAAGRPICLDSFGDGPKPVIDMDSAAGAVIQLEDQSFWEIRHLELTGTGHEDKRVERSGITVLASEASVPLEHILVESCFIHNIWGTMAYTSSGIFIGEPGFPWKHGDKTSFHDVLIAGNDIRDVDRCGVIVWTPSGSAFAAPIQQQHLPLAWQSLIPSTGVIVRDNAFEDLGGDAILVLGSTSPLIEGNFADRSCLRTGQDTDLYPSPVNVYSAGIWVQSCQKAIMQHNCVSRISTQSKNGDGMAYDFDFNCTDCILQYNVSLENQGGFMLIMDDPRNNIVRYNVSEDDGGPVLKLYCSEGTGNVICNNTIFTNRQGAQLQLAPGFCTLINNIFVAGDEGTFEIQGKANTGIFKNNCFWGRWTAPIPIGNGNLYADPKFVGPKNAAPEPNNIAAILRNMNAYRLRSDSPCRGAGILLPHLGDWTFFGDALPLDPSAKPSIGAGN